MEWNASQKIIPTFTFVPSRSWLSKNEDPLPQFRLPMEALAEALLYRPRPRMSLSLRTMYVLMKNPAPTPVEFARLFAEISLIDRPTDAGTITLAACKKAHRQHYPTFSLTEVEQRQHRAACFDKACPISGDGVKVEDTFCSPASRPTSLSVKSITWTEKSR